MCLSLPIFPPEPSMVLSSLPCVPYTKPISYCDSIALTSSVEKYTSWGPTVRLFSSLLLLSPFLEHTVSYYYKQLEAKSLLHAPPSPKLRPSEFWQKCVPVSYVSKKKRRQHWQRLQTAFSVKYELNSYNLREFNISRPTHGSGV
jgi:hypothetical protein